MKMKSIILTILVTLSTSVLASHQNELRYKAYLHLKKNGYGIGWVEKVRESDKSYLFLDYKAIDDEDYPCSIGVVVDKKTGKLSVGEFDDELSLSFAYADTSVDREKKLVKICAD